MKISHVHCRVRDLPDAARWFERNRAACGTAGLYCEEYDVAERQLRGNLPQAFVHALMLECAARLCSPWDPGPRGPSPGHSDDPSQEPRG